MRSIVRTLLPLALALLAACAGDGDNAGQPRPAVSCPAIRELESYRYRIEIKLQTPSFDTSPGTAPQATTPPLGAFAGTLAALLSDFEIHGAHIAPDRTQAILQFQEDEVELRQIGDRSWVRTGTLWQEDESSEVTLLTPETVCTDVVEGLEKSLRQAASQRDPVNGVDADLYRLDEADLERLPGLLGTAPGTKLPQRFQVEVWLARDGGWPVRVNITAADTDAQGKPIGVSVAMEVRDINDSGISIEPPVSS